MKKSKLLALTVVHLTVLILFACTPPGQQGPGKSGGMGPGGPDEMRMSASEIFEKADTNGDNVLSMEEFENSLPKRPSR